MNPTRHHYLTTLRENLGRVIIAACTVILAASWVLETNFGITYFPTL